MKHTILIFIILISISCKSQQPLLELYGDTLSNEYYQDIDNDLGILEGTWLYSDGNEILTMALMRKEFNLVSYTDVYYHEDVLYGEYQYVDTNGNEIHNTLSDIDAYIDVSNHLIYGNYIRIAGNFPVCEECDPNEHLVYVSINDPERDYFDYDMEIRHIAADSIGNGEQIIINIKRSDIVIVPENEPQVDRLPTYRQMILHKQRP